MGIVEDMMGGVHEHMGERIQKYVSPHSGGWLDKGARFKRVESRIENVVCQAGSAIYRVYNPI